MIKVFLIQNKVRYLPYQNTTIMYKVVEIKVFGMLAGYKVVDKTGHSTGFEYGEDEKYKAESRAELMNELRK